MFNRSDILPTILLLSALGFGMLVVEFGGFLEEPCQATVEIFIDSDGFTDKRHIRNC